MNPTTFSQWLASNPPIAEVNNIAKQCEEFRWRREALENKWEKKATPWGWGTEKQRFQLYIICESISEIGYHITYDYIRSTTEQQVWILGYCGILGDLFWDQSSDKFFTSTNLPFEVNHDGTIVGK